MHNASVRVSAAVSILVLIVIVACGTGEPASGPPVVGSGPDLVPTGLDPSTATLNQILERTRTAMGEVTSYKTRGEMASVQTPVGFDSAGRYFTEWQSPDRGRNRIEQTDSTSEGALFDEIVGVGGQTFTRIHNSTWREQPPRDVDRAEWPFSPPIIYLDAPDIELTSRTEITDEGVKVFRLEFSEAPRPASIDSDNAVIDISRRPEVHTVLLIDQETFLYVSVTVEMRMPEYAVAADPEPALIGWINKFSFYDYNVPVTINAPDEYEPWTGTMTPSSGSSSVIEATR